jgi:hypothetical protein
VPDEKTRKMVRRLLPVGEMELKAAEAQDADAANALVGEMIEGAFNSDEQIQELVSEMAPPTVRRRDENNGGGSGSIDKALGEWGLSRRPVKMGG